MKFTKQAGHFLTRARAYVLAHKIISGIGIVVFGGIVWFAAAHAGTTSAETRYVLGTVARNTVISTVTASGQISASRSVDIKPQVSGTITYVGVKAGEQVKQGQLIAEIDPTDAEKALRNAQTDLETAQLTLQKLQAPATALTQLQTQDAVSNAQDALTKAYSDSDTDIVNVFLAVPNIMTGLQDIDIGQTASKGSQWNIDYYQSATSIYDTKSLSYRNDAYNKYTAAQAAYTTAYADYKAMGPNPDNATIEKMASETYTMLQAVSDALGSSNSLLQYYSDTLTAHNQTVSTVATSGLTNLSSYITTINGHLSTLLADTSNIKNDKQSLAEKQQSLTDLNDGPDSLDVRSDEIAIQQKQDAVTDAQNTLAEYYIRAPFAGTVSAVNVYVGDDSGTAAIASMITPQQIAQLSLNEVDAAKVKVGDKATLTFDAIDGLTLTGTVEEIDPVGAVSQGVVSYGVQIALDAQNDQVKPGMTVNATIQTDVHQDVLTVLSSAVKTINGASVVQVFNPALPNTGGTQGVTSALPPASVTVQTGISDNTNIEITSGLTEGEQIVTKTSSSAQTTAAASTAARTGTAGAARGAGGFGGGAAIRL